MRPIKLILKNVGPYRDQTIDFSELDNIFLITGDTGAGKTFIFDAITYALYGKLSGNRAGNELHLRSRYVPEDDNDSEFSVTYEFSVGPEIYRIYRKIPRRDKNGRKGKEFTLEQKKDSGWEKIENGEKYVLELIGLKIEEFSKIVLLPQGAFADFLKQNSAAKAKILKDIFPVNFYTKIMEEVSQELKRKTENANEFEAIIKDNSKDINIETAEEDISGMEKEIKKLEKSEAENLEQQKKLTGKKSSLENDYETALSAENNLVRFKDLNNKKSYYDNLSNNLALAEKANLLSNFVNEKKNAEINKDEAEDELNTADKNLLAEEANFNKLFEQKSSMEKLASSIKGNEAKLTLLKQKCDSAEKYDELKNQESKALEEVKVFENKKTELKNQIKAIESKYKNEKIDAVLNTLNDELTELQNSFNKLETEKSNAAKRDEYNKSLSEIKEHLKKLNSENEKNKKDYDDFSEKIKVIKEKIEQNKLEHSAYYIAEKLKPGCPCPVCGSKEHPAIVKKPDVFSEDNILESYEVSLEHISSNINRNALDVSADNAKKDSLIKLLDELKNVRDTAVVEDEYNKIDETLDLKKKLKTTILEDQESFGELNTELADVNNELITATTEYSEAKTNRENLEKEIGKGENSVSLKEKYEDLFNQNESDKAIYDKWDSDIQTAETRKAAAVAQKEQSKKNFANLKTKFLDADAKLEKKISESDFNSLDELLDAMMDQDELVEQRDEVNEYYKNLKSAEDAVNNSKKTKSSEEIKASLDKTDADLQALISAYDENNEELLNKRQEHTKYKTAYDKIKTAQNKVKKLNEEIAPLVKLNEDLNGDNCKKLQFDTWALGMYFEQVVSYASARFEDISRGRFKFKFKEISEASGNAYRGLDLSILDTYTGTYSEPCDLSGGEIFEASISLALALTDVVQNNNGGIQLDSLFIDEGFGTLDSETMDKAMEVLNELGEHKMVGLISHVEGIQNHDFINNILEVHKTKNGSWVEIHQK